MSKRIKGILYYSKAECDAYLKAALVDVMKDMQGRILENVLNHPQVAHLIAQPVKTKKCECNFCKCHEKT
jgi:hypothetical protein